MPKPPPIEEFHVLCAISKDRLGEDMATLSRSGIRVVSCEMVTTVPAFAQRAAHDTNGDELLIEWIKDNPTFKAIEAGRHFEANGRSKTGVYASLNNLVETGVLKKLSLGHYARSDVKALGAPKKDAKKDTKKDEPKKQERRDISHSEFILRAARRNHGRFNTTKLKELFIKDGRNTGSVSPSIDDLIRKKLAKRVNAGEYVLLQKRSEEPKANGNGHSEPASSEEVNAHG